MGVSTQCNCTAMNAAAVPPASNEPTLDQIFAEPIVRQLMRRDQTDEATIRHLLQETAAARLALRAQADPKTDAPYTSARLLPFSTSRRREEGGTAID